MAGYAMYLRKSRADIEAEARGEGETLAKHEKALTELAKRQGLLIVKRYREIVSGENIASRPQMQALLADVNDGKYDGVLVVEIERLARGDTIDQGVVAQAFKTSQTKIITPIKVNLGLFDDGQLHFRRIFDYFGLLLLSLKNQLVLLLIKVSEFLTGFFRHLQ